ncbi:MAG: pyridoxal phosphate-dependent aminotransferase [Candidatus Pacebacteria bacterium]|nr:pyridoxal phosphate-dependent aminotransferase [Candidatus Paceibacterota bacterium]
MRNTITHPGADELVYEIREIVEVANKIKSLGQPIVWENIGDPVAKGERVPDWMKEYVAEALKEDATYGYSPTKGLLATREYIAKERNLEGGIQITPDDILFFNGLGDAIARIYDSLHPAARIIGPNPAYPTHSSAEAAHADSPHYTYSLDPNNGWQPDLAELERKIKENPHIAGILVVNPDNPTGFVYPPETLKKIVAIAKQYNLFIISDEIYSNLVYEGTPYCKLAAVIGDVPAIAMRGISKEFPWPGARCGWIEFYNRDKDEDFARFCKSLIDAKMLEVCATTLPQRLIPAIMSDARYYPYLAERNKRYQNRAEKAAEILAAVPELIVHKPQGAFYMTAVFKDGVLNSSQTLPIENGEVKALVEKLVTDDIKLDKRFVYYLLGSTGLCVVPLMGGFNSTHHGFRSTLLEPNEDLFFKNVTNLANVVKKYLSS